MPKEIFRNDGTALKPLQLLFVDDDASDLELCLKGLQKYGLDFQAATALTREDFDRALRDQAFDVVVADYRMKGWTGIDALAIVNEVCPSVPVILLSGTLGEELAVDCIKLGVTDYVLKNQIARLPVALRRAREERASSRSRRESGAGPSRERRTVSHTGGERAGSDCGSGCGTKQIHRLQRQCPALIPYDPQGAFRARPGRSKPRRRNPTASRRPANTRSRSARR